MEIFKLFGSIFVNTDDAEKSMQKTEKGAESVASKFSKGIQTAGKWSAAVVGASTTATVAVAGLASKTLDSYAEYEQLVGGVETLFKDSADIVMGYAENAYKTAGMTANKYMETVTGFSASLLQGLNGDTEEAAKVANMAIIDMSDNANKMGTSLESIQNAYQGFAKQNYTMLDNLKLGYGGTKQEMQRLLQDAQKFSGVEYNIDNLNDVYEAIHVIQNEMGIAGTTANEATNTISGSIGMIKTKMEDLKVGIGASIAPAIQEFLSLLIENLPKIENMFSKIIPIISQIVETLLPPLMQLVSDVLPVVMEILMALMPTVTQIVEMILPILLDLITTLLPPLLQIVQSLLPVVNALLSAALPILQVMIDTLKPILDLVIALLVPIIDIISQALQPLIEIIGILISTALKPLSWIIQVVGEAFGTYLKNMLQVAQDIIGKITGIFQGIVTFLRGVFTGNFEMIFKGLRDIVKNYFGGIVEVVKLPINAMISLLNGFISGLNKIQIPDWVPAVGGKGLNIPSIPLLEKGGVLEKGQVGLLEGNGAEAVVPLENNKRWISSLANEMQVQGIAGEKDTESASLISVLIQTIAQKIEDKSEIIIEVLERILERIEELGIKEDGDIIIPVYLMNNLIDEVIIDAKKRVSVRSGGMVSV